jgi:hypothetical protein
MEVGACPKRWYLSSRLRYGISQTAGFVLHQSPECRTVRCQTIRAFHYPVTGKGATLWYVPQRRILTCLRNVKNCQNWTQLWWTAAQYWTTALIQELVDQGDIVTWLYLKKKIVYVELLRSAQIDADIMTRCRQFDSKLPSCNSNVDVSKRNRCFKLR